MRFFSRFFAQAAGVLFFAISVDSSLADPTKKARIPAVHEVKMGSGCNIRLSDPYGGTAGSALPLSGGYNVEPAPAKSSLDKLGIGWRCLPADHEDVLANMKLSETTGLWSVDLSQIISSRQTQNEQKWALRWFSKNYKVVQLKAVNSRGYAVIDSSQTEFGTTPTENVVNAQKEGPIYLSFCLVHSPQAVCGLGLMGHKQEGHKADLTPYALKIIRSIEFID